MMGDLLADQLRHTTELAALVRVFGGVPAERAGMKSMMPTGRVALAFAEAALPRRINSRRRKQRGGKEGSRNESSHV